jgi:hypothetical protein
MNCPKKKLRGGWRQVVYAADCEDLGGGEPGACPCGLEYAGECLCPGPSEEGIEYKELRGILYGRKSQARNPGGDL